MKKVFLIALFLIGGITVSQAQISAGVNMLSSDTYVTIGTNPNAPFFGEGRISTGGEIGIELMGAYNFLQSENVNFYAGLGLGIDDERNDKDDNEFYIGVPFGLLVKPFSATRNFGIVLEAAPIFPEDRGSYFRAGFGFKYSFN